MRMKELLKNKHLLMVLAFVVAAVVIIAGFPVYTRRGREAYHHFDDTKKHVSLYVNEYSEILEMERIPDLIPWFERWYGNAGSNKLRLCRNLDKTPFITWEPKNLSLFRIAEGKYDGYIRDFFRRVSRICPDRDVLVRFAHEMELRPSYQKGWFSWQIDDGSYYIAAWKHVVEMGRELCPNIRWVWAPNRADVAEEAYYPGPEWVDYIAVTLNQSTGRLVRYQTLKEFYEREGRRDHLLAYGKKVIIAETGYALDKNEDPEVVPAFIRSVFDCLKEEPEIAAIVFFNQDMNDGNHYRISGSSEYMQIFYEGLEEIDNQNAQQ